MESRLRNQLTKIKIFYYIVPFLLLATATQAIGSSPAPTSDMVLFYKFANNSSVGDNTTQAYDYSGNNNNGSFQNSSLNYSSGYLGTGGVELNGINATVVSIINNLNLNFSNNFSAFVWVYLKSYPTSNAYVLSKSNMSSVGYSIYVSSTGLLQGNVYGLSDNFVNGGNVPLNSWTLVGVHSNSTHIYTSVNGIINTSDASTGTITQAAAPITLGARGFSASGTFLNGTIGETIIFNNSLNQNRIWTIYNTYYGCYNLSSGSIYGNTTWCKSNYYFNSSSTSSGAYTINTNGIVLNMNDSNFTGDGSGVLIFENGNSNIKITNARIINYTYGLWFDNSENNIFTNNYFEGMANHLRIGNGRNNTYYNNTFYNRYVTSSTADAAIYIYKGNASAWYHNVSYNNVTHTHTGIYFGHNASYGWIYGNTVYNNTGHALAVDEMSNYNQIYNNKINWSANETGFNGIRITSSYNNITYNNITNVYHVGIDVFACEAQQAPTQNNYIAHNRIINMGEGGHIQVCNSSNNYFYNNTVNNNTLLSLPTNINHAVYIRDQSSNNTFDYMIMEGNFKSDGFSVYNSTNTTIKNSIYNGTAARYDLRTAYSTGTTYYNISGKNNYTVFVGATNNLVNYTMINRVGFYANTSYDLFVNLSTTQTKLISYSQQNNLTLNGLNNSVVYHSNGTYECTGNCNGTRNVTVNANSYVIVIQNYAGQISFLDLYPVGDPSLSDGESQVFNYSLINPQGVSTNTNWFNEGSNITGCYNLSSCTLSVVGLTSGTRNITVSVTSASSGNLSYSWVLTIAPGSAETLAEICSNGANAQGELADWLQTIALVIAAVVVISAIGLYQSGNMPSFEVSGLGGVAIVLVGAAITIAVTSSIIVSAIC